MGRTDKKVAIVVVTFNRKDNVLKNLSFIGLLNSNHFEIIVFDNGSTDGTKEAVNKQFPHCNYHYSSKNLGGAGGFKKGMEIAKESGFDFIWCLDDDGFPHSETLNLLLQESEKFPNCILGTRIIPVGENKDATFWNITGRYDVTKKRIQNYSEDEINNIRENKLTHETVSVPLMGMFIPSKVIDQIGFPNENLFLANDDVEYCLRAWTKGVPVRLVMTATVEHPPMTTIDFSFLGRKRSAIKMEPWKIYYYIRNIVCVNKKYFRFPLYLKMVLMTVVTLFVNIFKNSSKTGKYLKQGFFAYRDGFFKKLINEEN